MHTMYDVRWQLAAKTMSTACTLLSLITLIHFLAIHQVKSHDNEGHGQSSLNVTELDCRMRVFAAEYAEYIQPSRRSDDIVFRQVEDALQLQILCPEYFDGTRQTPSSDITIPSKHNPLDMISRLELIRRRTTEKSTRNQIPLSTCTSLICIYIASSTIKTSKIVSARTSDTFEVPDIETALQISRKRNVPHNTTIVFRKGIHYVGSHSDVNREEHQPIELHSVDSGLSITGELDAWISGAIPLPSGDSMWDDVAETKYHVHHAIRVANLTNIFNFFHVTKLPQLISLFGHQNRYIRARYPNANPEVDQWGYNSPRRLIYSIAAAEVLEWHKPRPDGSRPTFTYVDLRNNDDDPNRPIKNDSTMDMYNVYSAGVGGVCSALWGNEPSYWCSNSSAGGWAEVDQQAAASGRLNIPTGMTYNQTSTIGQYLNTWNHSAEGGIIHAWHSQSWSMHMFRIKSAEPGKLLFEEGGGRQGGRNWCRCDQCSYAAPWCGQRQKPRNDTDTRLISGTWYVENILSELDAPGEFFFEHKTNLLYIYPNHTIVEDSKDVSGGEIPGLRFSVLNQLIRLTNGVSNVSISNLGFRDTSSSYMSDWSVPSGGDWSIHRGGAIFIEDADNIVINNCIFSRLDGNAIFLSRRTRNVSILRNVFEWIGESAVALWGQTDGFNATNRTFPTYTNIEGNVMREIGVYQKQSSGVFISKAAFTTIQNNLMFNIARAAINFNDMVGGGDVVKWNLLFNACRESGDHGPINSWDRQPFLADFLDGTTPSFNPIRRRIAYNLIFANYGANQAVDNDDGSSWYHISRNVMYWSSGFKMDYGGHDSIFEDNIVIGYPQKSTCVGFGSFYEGHGHVVRRNICFAATNNEAIIQLETCKDNYAILHDNQYFTPNGNATCLCGYNTPPIPFSKCKELYGIEYQSTVSAAPNDTRVIIDLALTVLFPENEVENKLATSE